jgi:hypothetical protein
MRLFSIFALLVCCVVCFEIAEAEVVGNSELAQITAQTDMEAVYDRIRQQEPELWRQQGGEEFDRQRAEERRNTPSEPMSWEGLLCLIVIIVAFVAGYAGVQSKSGD